MYKRVIIKLSGEALFNGGNTFDDALISQITTQIKYIMEQGCQVALVVGGGNYWRGREQAPWLDRAKSDQIGMLATVMNGIYFAQSLVKHDVQAVVQTPIKIGTITEEFSKERALSHMKKGRVLVFAGGTGHPFFSTDTITALRGAELEADALLFAKNIDGVYDSDPKTNPNAVKIDEIKASDILKNTLGVVDLSAVSLCLEAKIPVVIFGLFENAGIVKAANGERVGTIVTAD